LPARPPGGKFRTKLSAQRSEGVLAKIWPQMAPKLWRLAGNALYDCQRSCQRDRTAYQERFEPGVAMRALARAGRAPGSCLAETRLGGGCRGKSANLSYLLGGGGFGIGQRLRRDDAHGSSDVGRAISNGVAWVSKPRFALASDFPGPPKPRFALAS